MTITSYGPFYSTFRLLTSRPTFVDFAKLPTGNARTTISSRILMQQPQRKEREKSRVEKIVAEDDFLGFFRRSNNWRKVSTGDSSHEEREKAQGGASRGE
ncbi:hypothetical protein Droror1_Dr00024455 [Drosera rotundifolia]